MRAPSESIRFPLVYLVSKVSCDYGEVAGRIRLIGRQFGLARACPAEPSGGTNWMLLIRHQARLASEPLGVVSPAGSGARRQPPDLPGNRGLARRLGAGVRLSRRTGSSGRARAPPPGRHYDQTSPLIGARESSRRAQLWPRPFVSSSLRAPSVKNQSQLVVLSAPHFWPLAGGRARARPLFNSALGQMNFRPAELASWPVVWRKQRQAARISTFWSSFSRKKCPTFGFSR